MYRLPVINALRENNVREGFSKQIDTGDTNTRDIKEASRRTEPYLKEKKANNMRLIVGIDRKLLGLAFLLAVIVGANGSRIVGCVLFLTLCAVGHRLTRREPNMFLVLNQVRKQRALYDSMKRERVRLSMKRTEG